MTFKRRAEYFIQDNVKFVQGPPTVTMHLTDLALERVLGDFTDEGKTYRHNKAYASNGSLWTLRIHKDKIKGYYELYGVSGQYSFGRAPTYYMASCSGNKKIARDIFRQFIKEYEL